MILDYIENLVLSDDSDEQSFYTRNALAQLASGLFFLNYEVSRLEDYYVKKITKDEDDLHFLDIGKLPVARLSCMFQWYAVTVCSYAQLVGWLVKRNPNSAIEYVKGVMPKLYKYRGKVAAHFALTKPYKDDTEADLEASVMTRVGIAKRRIYVVTISPLKEVNGEKKSTKEDFSWSLTQIHKQLTPRYWPDGEPKFNQELMIRGGTSITAKIDWSDSL